MPDTHKRKTILKEVAIALIWPNPENPRSYDDPEAVKELETNMNAVGQRTPVKMVPLTKDEKAGTCRNGSVFLPESPVYCRNGRVYCRKRLNYLPESLAICRNNQVHCRNQPVCLPE